MTVEWKKIVIQRVKPAPGRKQAFCSEGPREGFTGRI